MEGDARQLFFLKSILQSFSCSTGLKVNFSKSFIVPINIENNKVSHLASTFGCIVGSFPFTYLELHLGITRPKIEDYLPLISKCERRLVSISNFLTQAGRLQITNVVLTALPTFHTSTIALPKGMMKQIEKYRKHCLWRGSEINSKKSPKAACKMICTM